MKIITIKHTCKERESAFNLEINFNVNSMDKFKKSGKLLLLIIKMP